MTKRRGAFTAVIAAAAIALTGFATTSVAYTTDIPVFGPSWGQPFLLGPGSIHLAHTDRERVPKSDLLEAVKLYREIALHLLRGQSS